MSEESLRKCIRSLLLREEKIHLHRWEEPEIRYSVDSEVFDELIKTGQASREDLPDPVDIVVNTFDEGDPRREGVRKALDDPGIRPETRWEIARALAPHWEEFKKNARTFDLKDLEGSIPEWASSVVSVRQSRVGKGANEIGRGEFAALLMLKGAMMDPAASGRVDVLLPGGVNVHVKSTVQERHTGVTFYNVRSMPDEYFAPLGKALRDKITAEGVGEYQAKELSTWVWSAVHRRHQSGKKGSPENFNGSNLALRMDQMGIQEPRVWDAINQALGLVAQNMVDSGGRGFVLLFAPDGAHLYPSEKFFFARTVTSKDGVLELTPLRMSVSLRRMRHTRSLMKRWDGIRDAHTKRALEGEDPEVLEKELAVELDHWEFRDLKILANELAEIDPDSAEVLRGANKLLKPRALKVALANFNSSIPKSLGPSDKPLKDPIGKIEPF